MRRLLFTLLYTLLLSNSVYAQPTFDILPLGINGGVTDGNLSAYLLKTSNSENYIALDAGTLTNGLIVAKQRNELQGKRINNMLSMNIKSYLISHAHLDHIMGLLMSQPELREKQTIMAREETMQALLKHIFTWSIWGNFGDDGESPHLNFQHYQVMPLFQWMPIANTDYEVKAYPLSHGGMASTAFLVRYHNDTVLYLGDTGADSIEKSTNLETLWKDIAPLIRNNQLHAIMIECSFSNSQAATQLFGHMNPRLLMSSLRQLASITDPENPMGALRGLPIIVTHVKPKLNDLSDGIDTSSNILDELRKENDVGVILFRPTQGKLFRV